MMVSQEEATEVWAFIVEGVERCIKDTVRAGFIDRDSMIRLVANRTFGGLELCLREEVPDPETRLCCINELLSLVPEPAESLRSLVEHRVDTAFAAQAVEEATWPAITDNDRLNSAFETLEAQGILARQDFKDCILCGHDALKAEAEEKRRAGVAIRGWVFYHWDNTQQAMQGNGLYLQYRCAPAGGSTTPAVGREIVAELRARGLCPTWSGKSKDAIQVPLVWQRRVPTVPSEPDNDPRSHTCPVETLGVH